MSSSDQPIITIPIKFYYGVLGIAQFLDVHPDTAREWLRTGKIPGKKDGSGRWVLSNVDYYQSLQG